MTDEARQHGTTNADLMMAMVSGLPSDFLRRAALEAERRERREDRLKVLQARETERAEVRLAEVEARTAEPVLTA